MRFFEFSSDMDNGIDKFVLALKNQIGRYASKKAPGTLNWATVAQMAKDTGFEMGGNYETFKSIFNQYPILQSLIKDFDQNSITLKVPGAPDDDEQSPQISGQSSQDVIDQTAASAAPGQLAQATATPNS
jgi:hypothetical protein